MHINSRNIMMNDRHNTDTPAAIADTNEREAGFLDRNPWLKPLAGGIALFVCADALTKLGQRPDVPVFPTALPVSLEILALISLVIAGVQVMRTDTFTSRLMQYLTVVFAAALVALSLIYLIKMLRG
jgi:hypothetical protein